jgi:hypothetical protein
VVDQSHSFRFAQSAAVAAGDEGHAVAMETECGPDRTLDDPIDPAVLVLAERACDDFARTFKAEHQRTKVRVERYGEILSWIYVSTFRIADANDVVPEINVTQWYLRLGKSATGVKADLRTDRHPLRLFGERLSKFFNLSIRKLRLNPLCDPSDAKMSKRIRFGKLASDCLSDNLGQKLEFQKRRVVPNVFPVDGRPSSPSHVGGSVTIFHLTRIDNIGVRQKRSDGVPCSLVAAAAAGEEFRHPEGEGLTAGTDCSKAAFVNGSALGHPLSFSGLLLIACAKASRLFLPNSSVQILPTKKPVGRTVVPSKVSHRGQSECLMVCHIASLLNPVAYAPQSLDSTRFRLKSSTITPRGNEFLSCLTFSLTRGSHNPIPLRDST